MAASFDSPQALYLSRFFSIQSEPFSGGNSHSLHKRVVECGDLPFRVLLNEYHREQGPVFARKGAGGSFKCALDVGHKSRWSDLPNRFDFEADNASLVNRVEDSLMAPADDFTSLQVLASDVDEVRIVSKRPCERHAVCCVPGILQVANYGRYDLFFSIHPLPPKSHWIIALLQGLSISGFLLSQCSLHSLCS
jgi:hypothetical protein